MRFTPRTWSLLSIMLFVAAAFFWLKGNEYEARRKNAHPAVTATNTHASPSARLDLRSTRGATLPGLQLARIPGSAANQLGGQTAAVLADKLYPHRLRNTTKSLSELSRSEHAILLANALIDSDSGQPLAIPDNLKSKGTPGSYIVQWNSAPGADFRRLLASEGAEIVSYVPNNAYLVKATADAAAKLQGYGGVQAVLPYEPYYKLENSLLNLAVANESLAPGAVVRLTLFPGARDAGLNDVAALGATVLGEEASPFGPQIIIQPPVDSLASLASLDSVQGIEPVTARLPASDLSRIVLGVATNGSASNYMNLTGSNVLVNLNDTGIDTNHVDLKTVPIFVPPVIPMAGTDPDGHGTFVAGLIAGSGDQSPKGTNVYGSESNAVFRGMAPKAKLLALPLDTGTGTNDYPEVSDFNSDTWLIDTAARTNYLALKRTNSLISNNSWTYGRSSYDSAAARYDAAVRDALPGASESQPLLFVFAAGNSGFGDESGYGGQPDTIESPGTAKNVITVGALETLRMIDASYTNKIIITNEDNTTTTNDDVQFPFIGITDSPDQVASFSSRGNVGIGIEGTAGRFKPDVVAPGSMLVSARSSGWHFNGYNTNDTNDAFAQLVVSLHTNIAPYRYDNGTTFAAANVSGMLALIEEYFDSHAPSPVRRAVSPALMKALLINGSRAIAQSYDVAVNGPLNFQGWGIPNLPNSLSSYSTNDHASLDEKLLHLRYVEQSPTNALATGESRTWKVTLSTNASMFPLRVTLVWTDPPGNPTVGVKLVNDLDLVITNTESGIVFVGNYFSNGGDLSQPLLPDPATALPFDFVNNVENIVIGDPEQFGREFTVTVRAHRVNVNALTDYYSTTHDTNDVVQDYALVVSSDMGADPSFNDPEDTQHGYLPREPVFETFDAPTKTDSLPRPPLTIVTNGLPLLAERVGGNPTLVGTNAITNQWSFYVFTNVFISNNLVNITNGPYVAFATFDAPNLSTPSRQEADVDLYVSRGDPGLTNLNPKSLANAFKSTDRQGTETVAFTNSFIGEVFYVGVKSEDQKGGEFSLFGVSSAQPFEQERNGQIELIGLPYSSYLPDGTAKLPQAGMMIAIGLSNQRVARTVVTNRVSHQDFGDLLGVLKHKSTQVILNNHLGTALGTNTFIYDDNNFSTLPPASTGVIPKRSDGPGTLNDFAGDKLTGAWFLNMIDNAPSHTGRVEFLTITIDPLRDPLLNGVAIDATNAPGQTLFFPIDVGVGVTNLIFDFTKVSGNLDVYFRQFELPQTNLFDLHTNVTTAGLTFSFPTTNTASLSPGTHYLAVRNPSTTATVRYTIRVTFQSGNRPGDSFDSGPLAGPNILDAATTNQVIDIPNDKALAAIRVSVNMPHPRASDVIMSLLSPQGTRVVLAEQRGGSNPLGYGSAYVSTNATTNITTNLTYTVFTDDTNVARFPIKAVNLSNPVGLGNGTNLVNNGSFEGATNGNYAVGTKVAGWDVVDSPSSDGSSPAQVSIITGDNYAYSGTNALILGTAGVRRSITTVAGKAYKLRFAVRKAPTSFGLASTGGQDVDPNYQYLSTDYPGDAGTTAFVLSTNSKAFKPPYKWTPDGGTNPFAAFIPTNWVYTIGPAPQSAWIAPSPNPTKSADALSYTFRTYIDGYHTLSFAEARPGSGVSIGPTLRLRWGSDSFDSDILVNGVSQNFPSGSAQDFYNAPLKELGGFVHGLNIIDFVVKDSFEIPGIRVEAPSSLSLISLAPSLIDLKVAGRTVTVTAGEGWDIYTLDFIGDGKTSPLEFDFNQNEVWIDAVSIESTGDVFVQPEEPFDILTGERAIGQWTLVLQDARTGAVLPAGDLTWKLDLNFADPAVFAERLYTGSLYPEDILDGFTIPANATNRIYPGTLYTNQVHYFSVEPCANATSLTVTLTGLKNFDAIELLADRSGIPTGNPDTDDYAILRNNQNPGKADGIATFHIDTTRPAGAPMQRGKRVFFAVRNRFTDTTNSYRLNVTLSPGGGCPLPPPPILQKDIAFENTLSVPQADEGSDEGNLYQVNVAAGAKSISLNVQGDGDLAIVAQKNVPPTRTSFSHFQNTPGSGNEQLTITSNSGVPLSSGVWYVRVLNNSTEPVVYSITATGDIGAPAVQPELSALMVNGQLQIAWNGAAGTTYEVQASDDLKTWSSVGTVTASGGNTTFSPAAGPGRARFYRLVQQ